MSIGRESVQLYGTLTPPKTTDFLGQLLTKNAERAEKFKAIGAAISTFGLTENERAWRDRLGDHQFEPVRRPSENEFERGIPEAQKKFLTSRLGNGSTRGTRGPCLKTAQFIRTIRKGK